MKLVFPASSEDLADAFNNAISQGAMQRENQRDQATFWARFELIASDVEHGEIVADWFYGRLADLHIRVSRKEGAK